MDYIIICIFANKQINSNNHAQHILMAHIDTMLLQEYQYAR